MYSRHGTGFTAAGVPPGRGAGARARHARPPGRRPPSGIRAAAVCSSRPSWRDPSWWREARVLNSVRSGCSARRSWLELVDLRAATARGSTSPCAGAPSSWQRSWRASWPSRRRARGRPAVTSQVGAASPPSRAQAVGVTASERPPSRSPHAVSLDGRVPANHTDDVVPRHAGSSARTSFDDGAASRPARRTGHRARRARSRRRRQRLGAGDVGDGVVGEASAGTTKVRCTDPSSAAVPAPCARPGPPARGCWASPLVTVAPSAATWSAVGGRCRRRGGRRRARVGSRRRRRRGRRLDALAEHPATSSTDRDEERGGRLIRRVGATVVVRRWALGRARRCLARVDCGRRAMPTRRPPSAAQPAVHEAPHAAGDDDGGRVPQQQVERRPPAR